MIVYMRNNENFLNIFTLFNVNIHKKSIEYYANTCYAIIITLKENELCIERLQGS